MRAKLDDLNSIHTLVELNISERLHSSNKKLSFQAEASTEQPLMAVNMLALSASISNVVQLAVAEAMTAQWPAALSQDTQSSTDQSVAKKVNASLAEITQGTPPRSENIVTLAEPGLDSQAPKQFFSSVAVSLSSRVSSKLYYQAGCTYDQSSIS